MRTSAAIRGGCFAGHCEPQNCDKVGTSAGNPSSFEDEYKAEATRWFRETEAIVKLFENSAATQLAVEAARQSRAEKGSDSGEAYDEAILGHWALAADAIGRLLHNLWATYGHYEKNWMVPKRARLWVAAPGGGHRCTLALEVSLAKGAAVEAGAGLAADVRPTSNQDPPDESDANWVVLRNRFPLRHPAGHSATTSLGPASEELCMQITEAQRARPAGKSGAATGPSSGGFWGSPVPMDLDRGLFGKGLSAGTVKCRVTADDRYLAFLLTRIQADRFARLQWPDNSRPDPNWATLEKNPKHPWYVAPILVTNDEDIQWGRNSESDDGATDKEHLEHEGRCEWASLRSFVGYLTLDAGKDSDVKQYGIPSEAESLLQNELLHKLDLFTACLAERKQFRDLADFAGSKPAVDGGGQEKDPA